MGNHEEFSVSTTWVGWVATWTWQAQINCCCERDKRDTETWNFVDKFYSTSRRLPESGDEEERTRSNIEVPNSDAKLVALFSYSTVLKIGKPNLHGPFTEIPRKSHKIRSNQTNLCVCATIWKLSETQKSNSTSCSLSRVCRSQTSKLAQTNATKRKAKRLGLFR